MLIKAHLGVVVNIHEHRIELGLSGGKLAYFPIHEVNDYLKIEVKSVLDKKINQIFKIGQRVICGVSKIEDDREFTKIIPASYKPSEINQTIPFSSINSETVVYGVISEIEDHGLLVDCGIGNKKCFIKKSSVPNLGAYHVAMPVFFKFTEHKSSLNVLPGVLCDPRHYDGTISVSLITLLPGSYVTGIISDSSDSELCLKCSNLEVKLDLFNYYGNSFKIDDEVRLRVLSIDYISKNVVGSVLDKIMTDDKIQDISVIQVPLQQIIQDAQIVFLTKKTGVLNFTSDGKEFLGYFKREKLAHTLNSGLQVDGKISCKILKRCYLENYCIVSIDSKVIDEQTRKTSSVEIGELVEAEVKSVKERYYSVKMAKLMNSAGILPISHVSLKKKGQNEKLSIGDKIKVRIFTKSMKLLHVTALPAFISSRLPILGSGEFHRLLVKAKQSGEIHFATGIVRNISDKGIHVHGLDNVSGLIPLSHIPGIGSYDFSILDSIYKKGKTIKFYVNDPNRTKPEDKFFILSMKHEDLAVEDNISDFNLAKVGTVYKCSVWSVKSKGFSVNITLPKNKQIQGFLPFEHCSDTFHMNQLIQQKLARQPDNFTCDFPLEVVLIQISPILVVSAKTSLLNAAKTSNLFPKSLEDFDVGKTYLGWVVSHQEYGLMVQFPAKSNLTALLPFRLMKVPFDYRDQDLLKEHFPRGFVLPLSIREVNTETRKEKNCLKILVHVDSRHSDQISHSEILTDTVTLMDWTWSLTSSGIHGPCQLGSLVDFTFNKIAPLQDQDYDIDRDVALGLVTLKKNKTAVRAILLNHDSNLKVDGNKVKCLVVSSFFTNEPCLLLVKLNSKPKSTDETSQSLVKLNKLAKLNELSATLVTHKSLECGLISNFEMINQLASQDIPGISSKVVKKKLNIYTLQEEGISDLIGKSITNLVLENIECPNYLFFKHSDHPWDFVCSLISADLAKDELDLLLSKKKESLVKFKKIFLPKEAHIIGLSSNNKAKKIQVKISFLNVGQLQEGSRVLAQVKNCSPHQLSVIFGNGSQTAMLHRNFVLNNGPIVQYFDNTHEKDFFLELNLFKIINESTYILTDPLQEDETIIRHLNPQTNDIIHGSVKNNLKYGLILSVNQFKDVLVPTSKRLKVSFKNLDIQIRVGQRIKLKFLGDNRASLSDVEDDDLLLKKDYDDQLAKLIGSLIKKNLENILLEEFEEELTKSPKINMETIKTNDFNDLEQKYKDFEFVPEDDSKPKSKKRTHQDSDSEEEAKTAEKVKRRRGLEECEMEIAKKEADKGLLIHNLDGYRNQFDLSLLNSRESFELAVSNRPNVVTIWIAYLEYLYNTEKSIKLVRNTFERAISYFSREATPENDKNRSILLLNRIRIECNHIKALSEDLDEDERLRQKNEFETILNDNLTTLKKISNIPKIRDAVDLLMDFELFDQAENCLKWLIKQVKPLTSNIKDWTRLTRLNYVRGDLKAGRNYQINAAKFLKTTFLSEFAINVAQLELDYGDKDRGLAILDEQVTKNVKNKKAHILYIKHLVKMGKIEKADLIAKNALEKVKNIDLSHIMEVHPKYKQ